MDYEQRYEDLLDVHGKSISEAEALRARVSELKAALKITRESMDERHGYAESWEWKYGNVWDEEDMKVKAALERA